MLSGNVIRAVVSDGRLNPTRIAKEVRNASTEAAQIVMQAEERAAMLVAEAEAEAEAIFAESEDRGYAAGLEQWNRALAEAWQQRDEYLLRNESELVKLAVAVAAQLAAGAAQADMAVVLGTVQKAVKVLSGARGLTLKVNPREGEWVRQKLGNIEGLETVRVEVVACDAVAAGGCIVESETGIVDARLETQVAALEKILGKRADANRR